MAAYTRMQKARCTWGRFSKLLRADGASVETMGRFYRTVIQQTLLFGSATWVLTNRALGSLEHFHARCARGIAHMHIQRHVNGTWVTPHTADVLCACHLEPILVCIQRRRHTLFKHYAETSSDLYRRCLSVHGTTPSSMSWWKLDMEKD